MIRSKPGVYSATLSGSALITDADVIVQRLNPNGSDRTVKITPQARGRGFVIINTGTVVGATLDITDRSDTAVVSIDAGESYIIYGNGTGLTAIPMHDQAVVDLTLTDALTAAGDLINGALTINHATATVEGIDLSVSALTTARTGGEVVGEKITLIGLAGDTSGATYVGTDYNATDSGGSALFYAMKLDAGWDAWADLSECATGEADIILGDNLPSALQIREGANVHWTFVTTNSAEGMRAEDNIGLILGTGGDLRAYHDGTDTIFDSVSATAKFKFRLGTDTDATSFVLEQDGGNDLLTITADGQHAAYIKDDSTTAWSVNEAGNPYLAIDTSNAGALVKIGNATTNPQVQLLGAGGATLGGALTIGADVVLDRVSANKLRLASGDAFVMGTFQIHAGAGAPSGDLSGALTAAAALYLRTDAAGLGTVLYGTHNTGTNWGAVTFA